MKRIGRLLVEIEKERCIAAENCIALAPGLFRLDDEGLVAFVNGAPADIDTETLLDACAACPTGALIVRDENGRKLVP